jgi:hypothetical protein
VLPQGRPLAIGTVSFFAGLSLVPRKTRRPIGSGRTSPATAGCHKCNFLGNRHECTVPSARQEGQGHIRCPSRLSWVAGSLEAGSSPGLIRTSNYQPPSLAPGWMRPRRRCRTPRHRGGGGRRATARSCQVFRHASVAPRSRLPGARWNDCRDMTPAAMWSCVAVTPVRQLQTRVRGPVGVARKSPHRVEKRPVKSERIA